MDECQITSSMQQQRFKQQTSLNYAIIPENVVSERVVPLKIEYHANAKYENPLKFSEKIACVGQRLMLMYPIIEKHNTLPC